MMYKSFYYSPIGKIGIVENDGAIVSIGLLAVDEGIEEKETNLITKVKQELSEYFGGKRKVFEISISPKGTEFQKKVWQELRKIPYGQTLSYKQVAERIGNPNSFRAVGNACNKNPLLLLIPCHRVVSTGLLLGGFALGMEVKKTLLDLEKIYV